MIQKPQDFAALKRFILRSYEKQQQAVLAEFGGDDEEVQKRVGRLLEWADFCEGETRELQREARFNELFGRPETPSLGALSKHAKCELCHGHGVYWSDGCTPRQWNRSNRQCSGFVTCRCEAGKIRTQAIRDHGKKTDKPSRYVQREEF